MPLHPLIVHFPIALLIVGALIEFVNVFMKKDFLNKAGTMLIVIGVLSGIVTLLSGEGAEEFAFDHWGNGVHDTVELHSFLAYLSVILFGLVAAIKILWRHDFFNFKILKHSFFSKRLVTTLIVILCIFGVTSLAITGHLGGKIVYENQIISSESNQN